MKKQTPVKVSKGRHSLKIKALDDQTKIGTKFWHHRRNIQKTPNKFGYSFVYS